jgi:hypothetical protein
MPASRAEHVHPSVVLLAWPSLELLHQRRLTPGHRSRQASTSLRSANGCSRSVRVRSSPGSLRRAQEQQGEHGALVVGQARIVA